MRTKGKSTTSMQGANDRMNELMTQALAEATRTSPMTPKEFFDDVHARHPEVILPTMAEGAYFTPDEDKAISRWAKLARTVDLGLMRIVDAASWERTVKSAYVLAGASVLANTTAASASAQNTHAFASRVLELAKERVTHVTHELLHYCPCYLFQNKDAQSFNVGDIEFIPGRDLAARITRESQTKRTADRERRDADVKELSKYPWIAVVPTRGYELAMAQHRSNDAARLAIAGIALNVTPRQCATMTLAYEWARPSHRKSMFQIRAGKLYTGYTNYFPQVNTDIISLRKFLESHRDYFDWLGTAIAEAFAPTPTAGKLREAFLNALHWYHTACTDTYDVRATICFTSALESLSEGIGVDAITAAIESLIGTARDKIVVPAEQWTLKQSVEYIYRYGRSESVHGGRFVLFHEYQQARALAAELTHYALISFQHELRDYEKRYNRKPEADSKQAFLRALKAT